MIRIALPMLLLGVASATNASVPQNDRATARFARTLAGLAPGAQQRCLRTDKYNELRTARGVVLFVAGKNRVWRNDVVGQGCAGLSRGDTVVTQSFNGQLCDGDIVRTRSATGGVVSGSCSLGKFTPYSKN